MVIEMRDVTSYYPCMAIKNALYPEHLGERFCIIYEELFNRRRQYEKGMNENKALKLSLNGTYGNFNNKYSPFFDPKVAMTITLNGQLLLCMLVEQLVKTPGLEMINVNTDGVCFIYPRIYQDHVNNVCRHWEELTQLNLETDTYDRFFQRNVNSYIGVLT